MTDPRVLRMIIRRASWRLIVLSCRPAFSARRLGVLAIQLLRAASLTAIFFAATFDLWLLESR